MTNLQVIEWVRDPARTRKELQAAASGLKLNDSGTKDDLRNRVIATLCSTNHSATAAWSPPVMVPTPVVTPIPRKEVVSVTERRSGPSWTIVLLALILVVGALLWYKGDTWFTNNGETRPLGSAGSNTTLIGGSSSGVDAASNDVCRLDKVGTWSEGNGPFRIEVGGHGPQHFDYYPAPGVKSVSYIVDPIADPEGVPNIVWGYGSLWEGDTPACQVSNFDWVADATHYAEARLDSGHSGLVVYNGEVVANVANLSDGEINQLVGNFVTKTPSGQEITSTNNGGTSSGASCKDGVREDHAPIVGQTWTPSNGSGFTIVNFWTNQPGQSQTERKLLLKPGQSPNLLGGGAAWTWPESCSNVEQEFAQNPLPEVTLQKLQSEGLVK